MAAHGGLQKAISLLEVPPDLRRTTLCVCLNESILRTDRPKRSQSRDSKGDFGLARVVPR